MRSNNNVQAKHYGLVSMAMVRVSPMCTTKTKIAFGPLGVPQCPAQQECRRCTCRRSNTVSSFGTTTSSDKASGHWTGKGYINGSNGIALQPF